MKCIEESYANSFYNNMDVQNIEIWWCNPSGKTSPNDEKLKSEFKKNDLYQAFSPFNFFRDNLVFEVSRDTTLAQLATQVLGKTESFVKYPEDELIPETTKVGDLFGEKNSAQDPILDLVIRK